MEPADPRVTEVVMLMRNAAADRAELRRRYPLPDTTAALQPQNKEFTRKSVVKVIL
jgi:hypothetical protein